MQFVVQSGAEPGRTYDLTPGKAMSVGRQSINEIVINDEQASRRHADLEVTPSGLLVTDKNSANGTFVNGTRISTPIILRPGDTLQIGTTVLKLIADDSSANTVASTFEQPAPPAASNFNAGYAAPAGTGTASQPGASSFSAANPVAPPTGYGFSQPAPQGQSYGTYDPNAGYGQQAQQQYAGGYDQNAAYGQQQQYGAGYDQNAYAQPQAPVVAKKGNNTLIIGIVGGVVVLAIVVFVLFAFVFNGGGGGSGVAGDLPAPSNGTKIDVTKDDFVKSVSTGAPLPVKSDDKFAAYSSTDKVDALVTFYKDKMKAQGYTEGAGSPAVAGTATLTFTKSGHTAEVFIIELSNLTQPAMEQAIPVFKGKLKAGTSLVMLVDTKV